MTDLRQKATFSKEEHGAVWAVVAGFLLLTAAGVLCLYVLMRSPGLERWNVYFHAGEFGLGILGLAVVLFALLRLVRRAREGERLAREEAEWLRTVMENIPSALFLLSESEHGDRRYLDLNPTARDLIGADVAGLRMNDVLSDSKWRRTRERICRAGSLGRAVEYHETYESDDGHREVLGVVVPMPGNELGAERYLMVEQDVTERKSLERQLLQAQKMEALGTLTAGIAHDFNNILTVMLSNVELVRRSVSSDDLEASEALDDLKTRAEDGADLVRKLLVFSHHQPMKFKSVDLAVELREAASTLRHLLPESIEVSLHVDPDLSPIRADRAGIQQMLMNLATNAHDAMSEAGRLRIEAFATSLSPEDRLQLGEVDGGRYVVVSVSDTGKGMDKDTRSRIFDPFFTTKDPGQGTGLGLSTVYSLVQQHGGLIHVDSDVGVGTTFRIYLPVASADLVAEVEDMEAHSSSSVGEDRTVLVVEDDAAIRRVAERMLRKLGFEVLVAADGEEGWAVFTNREDEVDIVVSDRVMPKLGGMELLARIRERAPDVSLILSSGYPEGEMRTGEKGLDESVGYLAKPWTVSTLAGRLAGL